MLNFGFLWLEVWISYACEI